MITAFYIVEDRIVQKQLILAEELPTQTIWLDLENPSTEEEYHLKALLNITIPTREEVWKNHVLNRMYTENGVSYMTAAVISKNNSPHPETKAVTFILSHHYLVTIRHISPTSFKNFIHRVMHNPQDFTTGVEVLEGLMEEIITRVAYNSELLAEDLDTLSHRIFKTRTMEVHKGNPSNIMKDILRRLGENADLNSKINESLHSIGRLLSFFRETQNNTPEMTNRLEVLVKDTLSLSQQTGFQADKITFLLDATLGMINVEQNLIIKIFSVVAVFFLPPTLISSIYGMNFEHMPELHWVGGYPFAVGLMLVVAIVPYIYFRKRKWL
jgi:magnesium transporter